MLVLFTWLLLNSPKNGTALRVRLCTGRASPEAAARLPDLAPSEFGLARREADHVQPGEMETAGQLLYPSEPLLDLPKWWRCAFASTYPTPHQESFDSAQAETRVRLPRNF